MTKEKPDTRFDELSRRRLLQVTGVGGLTTVAGCAGNDGDGSNDETTTSATSQPTTADPSSIEEGGTLVWGHSEVTQKLDPHFTITAASNRMLNNVYQRLVGLNSNLAPTKDADARKPGLAKDWTISEDRKTYTFTLRSDIKFHDGQFFTSADVKYSFDRIIESDNASASSVFRHVDSVEAPGDQTVVVNLEQVFQPQLRQFATSGTEIVPEGAGSDQLSQNPIGTGAFKFESREQGNQTILTAFEDFWGEPGPYIDTLEMRAVTDPDSRITGVESGDYDFINDVPIVDLGDVMENDQFNTQTWSPFNRTFLNFNYNKSPSRDPNFRKAIAYAIDKEELIEGTIFGHGVPSVSPSFPNSPFRNNGLKTRSQDLDKAKELLDNSEYEYGDTLTFEVTANWPWHANAALLIGQQLNEIGLNTEVNKTQWSNWISEVYTNGNYRLAMANYFGLWEPAVLYRNLYASGGTYNYENISDEEFESMLSEAEQAKSQDEAIQKFKDLQKYLYNEKLVDIVIWLRKGSMTAKPKVKGMQTFLEPDNTSLDFRQAWLKE